MEFVLSGPEEATPEWLTATLRRNGFIDREEVAAVKQLVTAGRRSSINRLAIRWSGIKKSTRLPFLLCLKRSNTRRSQGTCREVEIYTKAAAMMRDPPLVECYDAQFNTRTGAYHVLLRDMSLTHRCLEQHLPAGLDEAKQVVESLAKFHAFWWDHGGLGNSIGRKVTEYSLRRTVGFVQSHWPVLKHKLGDRITDEESRVVDRIMESALTTFRERLSRANLTLIHGDAHAMNFLVPKMKGANSCYILDWQTPDWLWEIWCGVSDLAYHIVRFWSARRRNQMEHTLLRHYLTELEKRNVADYSWSELFCDYRLSVVLCLFVVIHEACSRQSPAWYPQLENCLAAILDLNCVELFA
jgi:hypothetical protein